MISAMLIPNHVTSAVAQTHLPIQTKMTVRPNPISSAPIGCTRLVGNKTSSSAKTVVIKTITLVIDSTALGNVLDFASEVIVFSLTRTAGVAANWRVTSTLLS